MDDSEFDHFIPVTIVSGFLGAGKSTLVRRILTEDHGLKVLVVENEIGGDIGIESAIVTEGVDKQAVPEFLELPNGCVCCTVKDELVDSLSRLVKLKGFDLVLIETSGLADPGTVASLFWTDEELGLGLRFEGIISIVDCKNARKHWEEMLFQKQVAVADLILLNKIDLVDEETVSKIEKDLEKISPMAKQRRTRMSDCDIREATNLQTLRMDRTCRALAASREIASLLGNHTEYDKSVGPVTLRFQGSIAFDESLFERQLAKLFWENLAGSIWRLKALVNIGEDNQRWVYQGVHETFEGMRYSPWPKGERRSTLIFIGKNLNAKLIEQSLQHAQLKKSTEMGD